MSLAKFEVPGMTAERKALEEIEAMSFWAAGPAVDIARRALGTAPTMRSTVYEWCERHHAAEFAEGLCAVRALAPSASRSACEFVGTVWIGPESEALASGHAEMTPSASSSGSSGGDA